MIIGIVLLFIFLLPSIIFGWCYLILFIKEFKREWNKPTEEEIKQEIFNGMDKALRRVSNEINQQKK